MAPGLYITHLVFLLFNSKHTPVHVSDYFVRSVTVDIIKSCMSVTHLHTHTKTQITTLWYHSHQAIAKLYKIITFIRFHVIALLKIFLVFSTAEAGA